MHDPKQSKCNECGETGHPWWDCVGMGHVFGEDPIEPYLDWNLDPYGDGVPVTTRAGRRRVMAEHELDYAKPKNNHERRLYIDMQRGQ